MKPNWIGVVFRWFIFFFKYVQLYSWSKMVAEISFIGHYSCSLNLSSFADSLLVLEGIIGPVVSPSALAMFIRYINVWNLQYPNNIIIIKLISDSPRNRQPDFDYLLHVSLVYLVYSLAPKDLLIITNQLLIYLMSNK
jgi:hypothetical protein